MSRTRNAYCSFCRKSYKDVGPLVEGPGDVFICAECIPLCQSIINQERRRRQPASTPVDPTRVREELDRLACGQDEAKQAFTRALRFHPDSAGHVLLLGPSRSAKMFLARALAHALAVPFVAAGARDLVPIKEGAQVVLPLLLLLLHACDLDVAMSQHGGIVYLDGVERPAVQEASLRLWQNLSIELPGHVSYEIRAVRFVCGATFAGLDEGITSSAHPSPPITPEALVAAGARPTWVGHLAAIARTEPWDEETLTELVDWVDFHRGEGKRMNSSTAFRDDT
jgi:ATP-dependent Clp protease ATP-binding subunit ClpX